MDSHLTNFYWGVPALALVAGAVVLERRLGLRSPRWTLEMGDASYSIYLVHTLTLPVVGELLLRWPHGWPGELAVALTITVLFSVICGEAMFRLIERPLMEWFKGRRRSAIPVNS